MLGPAAYPLARLNNEWRYRIALKTRDMDALRAALREKIVAAARSEKTTRITINIDP